MDLYRSILRPVFFRIDAETIHHVAMGALELFGPALRKMGAPLPPKLARHAFGLRFPSPVGLAAGFDKNALALPGWEALGFGFAEVGTITAKAQPGNPKPRIFRVPEINGLINRLGFNNQGAEQIACRLQNLRTSGHWPTIPVGINLGKSKITPLEEAASDYATSFSHLQHLGDYFVLNVSSPNTPGLRTLQDRAALDTLLSTIQTLNTRNHPVLLKIAPDLTFEAITEILDLAESHHLAGLIATNTTINHATVPQHRLQTGGLSGIPVRQRSMEVLKFIVKNTRLPVISVGGIFDADDAIARLDAGACLVQLYTGLIYRGPALIQEIHHRLLNL
jgi:dihydroorotate dehydrogenase